MYVWERLENWKNYVPAARALANVIKWYTEPMQQRTRAASKYCRFYIESITSCPGSTDSDLLLILSHGILFSLIFGLSCLTAVEKQSVQARALEPMKIKGFFCKTTIADERN